MAGNGEDPCSLTLRLPELVYSRIWCGYAQQAAVASLQQRAEIGESADPVVRRTSVLVV